MRCMVGDRTSWSPSCSSTWCQVFCSARISFLASSPGSSAWCLLLLTLGMAFTGQVMRFDQDAYWGLGIGASIVSRVPFVGAQLVHLLGGPIMAGRRCLDSLRCMFS